MLDQSVGATGERVYAAPDIASALEFVIHSQRDGRYQFFRGQANATWLPYPSLARVPDASRDQVEERLLRFIGYARDVSQIAGIRYSDDAIWAIAQHYGLPTNFLDLTTDPVVAAMFACPPVTAWGSEQATILLYAQKTIDLWCECTLRPDQPDLELLRIDVSNLWRFQAQRGLFLFNPFVNFCDRFMPDRVTFPHPANGFVQHGYELYPNRKSPLELQLDLFFDLEATEKAKKDARAYLPAHIITPALSDKIIGDTTLRLTAARANRANPFPWAPTAWSRASRGQRSSAATARRPSHANPPPPLGPKKARAVFRPTKTQSPEPTR